MKGKDESTVLQNFLFLQQNPQEILSFHVTESEQVLIQVEALVKMERAQRTLHRGWQTPLQNDRSVSRERMVLEAIRYLLGTNTHARQNLVS